MFRPNWTWRGGWSRLMVPKPPPIPVFGLLRLTWLKELNASARNLILTCSVAENSLRRLRSQTSHPGPTTLPMPALPSRVVGGAAKTLVLNHLLGPRWSLGSDVSPPRYRARRPWPALEEVPVTVRYWPLWKRVDPLNSHPPSAPRNACLACAKNGRR